MRELKKTPFQMKKTRVSLDDLVEFAGITKEAQSPQTKKSMAILLVHGLAQFFCPLRGSTVDAVIAQLQDEIGIHMLNIVNALDSAALGEKTEMDHFNDTIHREHALTQLLDHLVHVTASKTPQASLSPEVADTITQYSSILDSIYPIFWHTTSILLVYHFSSTSLLYRSMLCDTVPFSCNSILLLFYS